MGITATSCFLLKYIKMLSLMLAWEISYIVIPRTRQVAKSNNKDDFQMSLPK